MPNWNQILNEIGAAGSIYDVKRRQYLRRLSNITGRNVIIYYSGWLQKRIPGLEINDEDKNGFMTVIHQLDRERGVDILLHTPGGEMAATESLVDYLRSMFGNNIRAIIPQLALSGGTMIACACDTIIMGKQSSLGPIDPQFRGIPAHGVIDLRSHVPGEYFVPTLVLFVIRIQQAKLFVDLSNGESLLIAVCDHASKGRGVVRGEYVGYVSIPPDLALSGLHTPRPTEQEREHRWPSYLQPPLF